MNTCTSDDQRSETWIEVHALGGSERAACFVTFLLQAVPGAELGFGPRAADSYRFHLDAPPSTFIRALLESAEFAPAGLRYLDSGDLQVTLRRAERGPETTGHEAPAAPVYPNGYAPAEQRDATPTSDEEEDAFSPAWTPIAAEDLLAEPEPGQTDVRPPLDGALEQLDSAIGELLEQLTVETAGPNEAVGDDEAVGSRQSAVADDEAGLGAPHAVPVQQLAGEDDEAPPGARVSSPSPEGAAHAEPETPAGETPALPVGDDLPISPLPAREEELALPTAPRPLATSDLIPGPLPTKDGENEAETGAASAPTQSSSLSPQSSEAPAAAEARVSSAEPEAEGEKRYHIIVGDDCPVCRAVSRISFTADRPPQLPIAGCRATDGCGCSLPEFEPETRRTSPTAATGERGLAFHGQIQLVAHPFGNFGRLNQFITLVGALPGVRSVTLRRFRNGILRLAVDYSGTVPLSTQLTTGMEIPLEIVSDGGDLIEIAVTDDGRDRQPSLELVSIAARGANPRRPASA